ncbi:MAG: LptF/LptG family permease [Phycisphaerales bacterium]
MPAAINAPPAIPNYDGSPMPWTLWRYIFIEVGKLVLLSTAVLVAVIAFAATVKPLADGKLTALDALRFMFYAVPPMLAYALPFAAGFGATLAYHRMAQDNEVTATFAGGLSHLKVLAPALAIGAVLSFGLATLNAQIIPRFLTRMERIVTKDLAQVMIRSLEQGDSSSFGNAQIHADAVARVEPSSDEIDDQFRLLGVVAVTLDDDGEIVYEVTASEAYVFILRAEHLAESVRGDIHPSRSVVRIRFTDAYATNRRSGEVLEGSITTDPYELPNAFQDDPKFLTAGQLRELRNDPERMNWIDERRIDLARAIASDETIESLRSRAQDTGTVTFRDAQGAEHRLRTGSLKWDGPTRRWRVSPTPGLARVELEVYPPDGTIERYSAERAWLEPVRVKPDDPFAEELAGSMSFELTLERVQVRTGSRDTMTERPRWRFDGLTVDGDPYPSLRTMPSKDLIARAAELDKDAINSRARRLVREIDKLNREITSKQHERLAMNASCLVMVFTGAVMALRLRQALPLVVYMWSFFPALGTIIFISSGQSTTHRQGWIGLPILWFGVVGLGAFAVWMYLKLRRH